jgi:hypothetical protein
MRDRHSALKQIQEVCAAMPRGSSITVEISDVPRALFDTLTAGERVARIGGDLIATVDYGGGVYLLPRTQADVPKPRHLRPVA